MDTLSVLAPEHLSAFCKRSSCPLEKLSINDCDNETDMLLHLASITTLTDLTITACRLEESFLKALA